MSAQVQLHDTLAHVPVGVFTLDRSLRILSWNRCLEQWTGLLAQDMLETPITQHFPALGEARFSARIHGVFSGGPPVVFSSQLHHHIIPVSLRDGTMQAQQCVIQGIRSATPDEYYAMVVIQDVTAQVRQASAYRAMRDRAQAELESRIAAETQMRQYTQSLEEANGELNLFASIVSHDLRAPLRRIVMLSDFVSPGSSPNELTDFLGQIRDAAKRAHALVEDLSSYSRITCDRTPEDQVDLSSLIADVLTDLANEIIEARAVITVSSGVATLPTVLGNATQLRRLLQNLIENAIKYRSRERTAKINVEARYDEDMIYLAVNDNGMGIEPEFLKRVFEPFQRSQAAKIYPGTGIGLAICKRVCQLHQGDLTVKSTVDQGSRFEISLPAKRRAAPPVVTTASEKNVSTAAA